MPPFRTPVGTTYPFAPARALSNVATTQYSPFAFQRGGPLGRAMRLAEQGQFIEDAAAVAAKQGKGHLAEVIQAARYGANSGAVGAPFRARPNPRANDPRDDVHVVRGRRRVAGAQIKMGSPDYVRRALRNGRYGNVIVNSEVFEDLERSGEADWYDVTDRLRHRGTEAVALRADDCEHTAAAILTRVLAGDPSLGKLEVLLHAARAGLHDGVVNVGFVFLGELVHAVWEGAAFDARTAMGTALKSSARAVIKTTVQTHALLTQFVRKARRAFSDRLIHRIARSSLVVGAFAEVIVEVGADLIAVLRKELTFDELLRRLGVHVATATGAAVGAAVGAALTRGGPWWLQALAMLIGGCLGGRGGRALGTAVFMQPALPPASGLRPAGS